MRDEADADLRAELMIECERVVDILLAKRHDYGTKNIGMTGRAGLAVRLLDKAARLWTLSQRQETRVAETLADTYRDMMGYALIGLRGEYWDLKGDGR